MAEEPRYVTVFVFTVDSNGPLSEGGKKMIASRMEDIVLEMPRDAMLHYFGSTDENLVVKATFAQSELIVKPPG